MPVCCDLWPPCLAHQFAVATILVTVWTRQLLRQWLQGPDRPFVTSVQPWQLVCPYVVAPQPFVVVAHQLAHHFTMVTGN